MAATINIVQGSSETVNVTLTDTTGAISNMNAYSPDYTVLPYDSTLSEDESFYYAKYAMRSCIVSGMMLQCLIDTSINLGGNVVEATNAPSLPVTITGGSNDTWKLAGTSFTIPAGTYATVAALAAAFEQSVDVSSNKLNGSTYSINAIATVNGKLGLYSNVFLNTFNHYDGIQILDGATHNALPTVGFTNAQTFAINGATILSPGFWDVGRYSLYVHFNLGTGEKPFLGPVPIIVSAT